MTPDRRLDQLEPLVADGLQKIDRLIEGQGQLLEVATRADQKADTTAKGLANLTIKVNQIADQQIALIANVGQIADQQVTLTNRVGQIADQQITLTTNVSQLADQQVDLTTKVDQLTNQQIDLTTKVNQLTDQQANFQEEVKREFQQVNQKFDLVIDLLRQR